MAVDGRGIHLPLEAKTHALGEVMINAVSLREFLADAQREGCVVVHD